MQRRRLVAALVLCGACLAGMPAAAAAIYAGPTDDPLFGVIAPELANAMFPNQRLDLVAQPGAEGALDRVVEDPASLAITDLATMLDYARRKGLAADRLEFHSLFGQHCLMGFTQRGGWIRAFADVTTTTGTPRPVLGVADAQAAAMLALLRRLDPGLDAAEIVQEPMDALRAKAGRGAIDVIVVLEHPEFPDTAVDKLSDDERLSRLPVVTRLLVRAAADRDSGLVMTPMHATGIVLPWERGRDARLCTPIGAVLRADAPPALRDAVNRAAPMLVATLRTTLADRALKAGKSALGDAVTTLKGLLDRF